MRARTNSIVLSARDAAPLSAAYITRRLPRTRNSAISSLWIAVAFVRTRSVATPFASAANLKMTQTSAQRGNRPNACHGSRSRWSRWRMC